MTNNRPKCSCAAENMPHLEHSYNCPVTRWERLLNDEVVSTMIAHSDDDSPDVEVEDISPLPDGDPNDWTEEEWVILADILDRMPMEEAKKWEEKVYDRLAESPQTTAENIVPTTATAECKCKPEKYGGKHSFNCVDYVHDPRGKACNCHAEKYKGVHTSTCPCHKDYKPGAVTVSKPSCKHDRGKPFELGEGLSVGLVAWRDVKFVDDETVNVGVYLYDAWLNGETVVSPGLDVPWSQDRLTKVVLLEWPDYKAFSDLEHLKEVISWMLDEMAKGVTFETGCMGGHGRTGTMAACLMIAADAAVIPAQAIESVRKGHCKKAVENKVQIDMVAAFYKVWHGHENWRGSKPERKRFNKLSGSKAHTMPKTTVGGNTTPGGSPTGKNWWEDEAYVFPPAAKPPESLYPINIKGL